MKPNRWFRYGEPWGLLSKANPRATAWTVFRHAVICATAGAIIYGLVIYYRDEPTPYWHLKIGAWSIGCFFIGALWEWQVRDDENL